MAPSLLSACPSVFLPLTIFIAVVSTIGCLGNGLAFYIFNFRYTSSGFNTLLGALAALDAFACLVHMPLDILTFIDIGHIRSYLCKITCFQLAFTATGSALILLVIAIVRFNGIRRPSLGQFETKSAYWVIVVSLLLASGISLPITMLFGAGRIEVAGNVTVEICAVEGKFMHTSGPLGYYVILATLYIITFVVHSGLYAHAMYMLWHKRKVFVSMRGRSNVVMLSPATTRTKKSISGRPMPSPRVGALRATSAQARDRTESSYSRGQLVPDIDSETDSVCSSVSGSVRFTLPGETDSTSVSAAPTTADSYDDIIELSSMADQRSSSTTPSSSPNPRSRPVPAARRQVKQDIGKDRADSTSSSTLTPVIKPRSSHAPTRKWGNTKGSNNTQAIANYRILGVVIAISMTYFLSYAPHFGVMFYLFTHDASVFSKSSQNLVFELLMRSFFLNNVLDPVIYGLLSAEFRRETIKTFKLLFKKCCPCFT